MWKCVWDGGWVLCDTVRVCVCECVLEDLHTGTAVSRCRMLAGSPLAPRLHAYRGSFRCSNHTSASLKSLFLSHSLTHTHSHMHRHTHTHAHAHSRTCTGCRTRLSTSHYVFGTLRGKQRQKQGERTLLRELHSPQRYVCLALYLCSSVLFFSAPIVCLSKCVCVRACVEM